MRRFVLGLCVLATLGGCAPEGPASVSRRVDVSRDAGAAAPDGAAPRAKTLPPRRIATH